MTSSGSHRVRTMTLVALAGIVAMLAAACGVGLDAEPREIDQPESTTTTQRPSPGGVIESTLYFVRDGMLLPVISEVPDDSVTSDLEALLQPERELTEPYGLGSSIPAGTELLGIDQNGSRLTVNLSSEFANVVGVARQQAIGQIVLTLTEHISVRSLSFEIDGRALSVASPVRGDRMDVRACDFSTLLATPDQALDAGLPAETIMQLESRYDQLRTCDAGQ